MCTDLSVFNLNFFLLPWQINCFNSEMCLIYRLTGRDFEKTSVYVADYLA